MITLPAFQMPLPTRTGPSAFAYARQSHQEAIDAGEGIPAQGHRARAYWEAVLKPAGVEHFVFIPDESAVSARTNPFMLRHAGRLLFDLLQPGDYFIIDKIDRLWRSVEDFANVMKMFKARGIKLCIVNMMGASITLGTPMGDLLMNISVAFAQLESDQAGDRTRTVFRTRRQEGRYPGGPIPIGCRLIGSRADLKKGTRDTRQLIWDPEYRKFMGEIVRLADIEGQCAGDIAKMIPRHIRALMGEQFFRQHIVGERGRTWDAHAVARHFWRERQYRALPLFNPNSIRFRVFNPPGKTPFRDIGRNEPMTPNPFPFLDGRPIPTLAEFVAAAA